MSKVKIFMRSIAKVTSVSFAKQDLEKKIYFLPHSEGSKTLNSQTIIEENKRKSIYPVICISRGGGACLQFQYLENRGRKVTVNLSLSWYI